MTRARLPSPRLCGAAVVVSLTSSAWSQEPTRPPAAPEQQVTAEQQAAALIDRFHAAMPHDPAELRRAEVRSHIAPMALGVLREIATFARDHTQSPFASRRHEFTIYRAVLGDAALLRELSKQRDDGDAGARLLLDCSAAIVAGDHQQRSAAVEAVAGTLREHRDTIDANTARAMSFCLAVAGELSEAEAKLLAKATADREAAARLSAAAQAAAKHPRRLLGQPFALVGQTIDGKPFDASGLRGKVVLIDFWATWCKPCVAALPSIVAARDKFAARGLEVVGVSSDREVTKLREFLAAHQEIDWPQLFEPGNTGFHPLAVGAGVQSIPSVFLLDRHGVLRSIDPRDQLDQRIEELLGK